LTKTNARMQTYIERQKDRGLISITLWVPKEYVSGIRKMADHLRRMHGVVTLRSKILYGDNNDE